jgi:hypothetical protein
LRRHQSITSSLLALAGAEVLTALAAALEVLELQPHLRWVRVL